MKIHTAVNIHVHQVMTAEHLQTIGEQYSSNTFVVLLYNEDEYESLT